MSFTLWEISGPIPSPSMKVTIYFSYEQSWDQRVVHIAAKVSDGQPDIGTLLPGEDGDWAF